MAYQQTIGGAKQMKKTIKRIALTITVLLALIGATGTVALASGYITWKGSEDFHQTLINLNLISERGRELTADNENIARELEQTRNQLLDKDNHINALEQEIEVLEKRVDGNRTTQDQLKQAEKDMRDVKQKSEEVLSEFN